MNSLTQTTAVVLLEFVWQGALVAMVSWLVLYALRRSRPEVRYVAACTALLVLAILPAATAWKLYAPSPAAGAAVPEAGPSLEQIAAVSLLAPEAPEAPLYRWIVAGWLLGVVVFATRLVWSAAQLAILRRTGVWADEETARFVARIGERMHVRRVRILLSRLTDVPSVIGWCRPIILLPAASLAGLTPSQLEAVIAHELAHIRRHDYLINIFQMVVETLLFYHPAVWWVSGRIRLERELCCDDLAVRTCGDAVNYARALAEIEKLRVPSPQLAIGSGDGPLLFRIRRLVTPNTAHAAPSRAAGLLILLCLVLPLPAITTPQHETANPATPLLAGIPAGALQLASAQAATTPASRVIVEPAVRQSEPQRAAAVPQSPPVSQEAPAAQQRRETEERISSSQVTWSGNAEALRRAALARQLAEMQIEANRLEELSRRGLVSPQEAERLRVRRESIEAEFRAAERALQSATESTDLVSEELRRLDAARQAEQVDTEMAARITQLQAVLEQLQAMIRRRNQQEAEALQAMIRSREQQMELEKAMAEIRAQMETLLKTIEVLREEVKSGTAEPNR